MSIENISKIYFLQYLNLIWVVEEIYLAERIYSGALAIGFKKSDAIKVPS